MVTGFTAIFRRAVCAGCSGGTDCPGRFCAVLPAVLMIAPTTAMTTNIIAIPSKSDPSLLLRERRREPAALCGYFFSSLGLTEASVAAMESRMRVSEMTFCI